MKKLVSILLAIAVLFTFSMSVLAVDTSITITDATRTYAAYKLLDVTSSLKPDHVAHDGECTSDHFNYSYTVRTDNKYFAILQDLVDPDDDTITLDQIAAYLEGLNTEAEVQAVADKIYRAIKAAGLDADETVTSQTQTLTQGYWLFADITGVTGENANSLVVLNTKGIDNLEISPKTSLPTLTKEVLEVNDTLGTNAWGEVADYDMDDEVTFKLTATLPANYDSYESYTLTFMDNLADGFANAKNITVTATTNGNPVTITQDVDYTIGTAAGYDFTVVFANLKTNNAITAETVFVVTYTADLTGANVVVGEPGNLNTVDLVFSNNPYGDSTGELSDEVTVYTYQLVVDKVTTVDGQKQPLTGAGFTLYKEVEGAFVETEIAAVLSNDDTTFTFTGLDAGTYKLVESTVPAGYNKADDITFTVDTQGFTTLTSTYGVVDAENGIITGEVLNLAGTVLPSTGAEGTMWLIAGGATLVILAAVFMITRKKMSVYED